MNFITYLSLGAGVQSSALYVLAAQGKVPQADVAIFADTQSEPAYVYRQLDNLRKWGESNGGPPILTATLGNLGQDTIDRHQGKRRRVAAIPAYTSNESGRPRMLMRHCTREYKVEPIEKCVREIAGLRKGQHAAKQIEAVALIGISADESIRMKPSPRIWITHLYPLVDLGIARDDCLKIVRDVGLPEPEKSSCVFCPFHDDNLWVWLKQTHPGEFQRAVEFDAQIRDMTRSKVMRPVFLHRSLVPLDQVVFRPTEQKPLLAVDGFGEECSGMCGV